MTSRSQRRKDGAQLVAGEFVGRRRELEQLRTLLREERLVTLHGGGGCGKTRLALEHAALARAAGQNVVVVDLASLGDGSLLSSLVASALGVPTPPGSATEAVLAALARRETLLILDNCEHLVGVCARFVEGVLGGSAATTVLATSRVILGASREVTFTVRPLPGAEASPRGRTSDAVRLFATRARQVSPGRTFDETDLARAGRICALVDGNPLAIELAATRTRFMGLEEIEAGLARPLELLRAGGGVPGRHPGLEESIQWSYGLCTAPEQRGWACLSVFRGSFTARAAQHVLASAGIEPSDRVLESLVEKSIVEVDATASVARFRMLELMRQFGADVLRLQGNQEDARLAHAVWYSRAGAELEEQLLTAGQLERLRTAIDDLPNYRAAADFALSSRAQQPLLRGLVVLSAPYIFWSTGRLAEGAHWLTATVRADGASPEARLRASLQAAVYAYVAGVFDEGALLLQSSRSALSESDEPLYATAWAGVAFVESLASLLVGDFAAADVAALRGLELLAPQGLNASVFRLLQLRIYAHNGLGDPTTGRELCLRILELGAPFGEAFFASFADAMLAMYAWRDGAVDEALAHLDRALPTIKVLAHGPETADLLRVAGLVAHRAGDESGASILLGAADAAEQTRLAPAQLPRQAVSEVPGVAEVSAGLRQSQPERWQRGQSMSPGEAVEFALSLGAAPGARGVRSGDLPALTRRELEVARLVADGLTNREIAERLVITVRSAEGHVERIRKKLGARSRVEVATIVQASLG
jgi:non-specific serine/threonine protein kinase